MKHEVFISYSSINSEQAFEICRKIEESGHPCWIAPRNEQAGTSYGLQITNAIKQAQVIVLVFSEASNKSEHVLNEVGLAFNHGKKIVPFLLDDSEMCADMQYYLARKHHIKAKANFSKGIEELIGALHGYLPKTPPASATDTAHHAALGQQELGTVLTEALINASTEYSVAIQRFQDIIKGIPNWTRQERILSKAKEIISYSFVGVIGKAFGRLVAISKETGGERASKFCQECKRIVYITLNLSEFALISKLWDHVNNGKAQLGTDANNTIRQRLNTPYQLSVMEHLNILSGLVGIYADNADKMKLPIPEMEGIRLLIQPGGEVFAACEKLLNIANDYPKEEDCVTAENALSTVLRAFNFFMRYNIVSMKMSRYEKSRTDTMKYLHHYVKLGLDNKSNMDMEKVNLTDSAIITDSVVLYEHSFSDPNSINLYPLVIDLNTLYREHGSKICFFNTNSMIDSSLEYLSLDDHSTVVLDAKKVKVKVDDLSELFSSDEDIAAYNIDNTIDTFNSLQQSLLGEEFIDFGDL